VELNPQRTGGCPVAHPVVLMIQALAKHIIEQLVELPIPAADELRLTIIREAL
jgi:hypothetical protein